MSRKRYTTEQIINKLREADVELAKGQKVPEVCRKLAVHEQTYYRSAAGPRAGGTARRVRLVRLQSCTGAARRHRLAGRWRPEGRPRGRLRAPALVSRCADVAARSQRGVHRAPPRNGPKTAPTDESLAIRNPRV
ncbi:MAG: hypothetical protein D6692_00160 [Planctomycetota bacterium]|nr:MAG: hypothetical protein D6692_00160 [Planctomycetota bacterium]